MKQWLMNLIKRGRINSAAEGVLQTVKLEVSGIDVSADVERWQQLGLATMPNDGVAALVLSIAGHRFVIALEDTDNRPKDLQKGEVALWHANGDRITLKDDNTVHVKTKHYVVESENSYTVKTKQFNVEAQSIKWTSAVMTFKTPVAKFGGLVQAIGDVQGAGVSLSAHTNLPPNFTPVPSVPPPEVD